MSMAMRFSGAPVMDEVTIRLDTSGATFDLQGTEYPQDCFFIDGGGASASLGGVALAPLAFGFSGSFAGYTLATASPPAG